MNKIVPALGAGLIIIAAIFSILHTLVINPLYAMPNLSLAEIYSSMENANESPSYSIGFAVAFASFGVIAALVSWYFALKQRWNTGFSLIIFGALAALATPAYFLGSFSFGMSMADTFFISGGGYSPWGRIFYLLSLGGIGAILAGGVMEKKHKSKY